MTETKPQTRIGAMTTKTTLEKENLELLNMVDAFGNFVRAYADGADRLLNEHTKIMQKIAEMRELK